MLAFIYGVLFSVASSGQPLVDHDVFALADTVKRPSRNKGFDSDSARGYLEVNRVIILGNKLTRNSIILRELSLKKGDIINEADLVFVLEKDQRKLFNLRLFNTVTLKPLNMANGVVDLLIEVDERWYTFPAPIFQLSDRNFNEWWENYNHDFSRVNYGLKLYQYNVWGRNQTLTLIAQFGFQKRFEFQYRIPYIDKNQKQGLIFELDFSETKNVADSTINHKLNFFKSEHVLRNTKGVGITYTYRNNFYIQHRLKYEYRQANIDDTLQYLNPNYLGSERKQQEFDAVTYEFTSDHRDVTTYSLHGYQFNLRLKKFGIGLNQGLNKTEGSLSFAGFLDLKKNYFLSNLTFLYASTPDKLPYYNYGAMGYNRIFVRGYEVYVIEGPQFFLNKTTFKKKIFSKSWNVENSPIPQFNYFPLAIYLKAYTDFGYVNNYPAYADNSLNTLLTNKAIGGAGFGIDFVSAYDLVIRFEYTFTTQKQNGLFFHIKKEF